MVKSVTSLSPGCINDNLQWKCGRKSRRLENSWSWYEVVKRNVSVELSHSELLKASQRQWQCALDASFWATYVTAPLSFTNHHEYIDGTWVPTVIKERRHVMNFRRVSESKYSARWQTISITFESLILAVESNTEARAAISLIWLTAKKGVPDIKNYCVFIRKVIANTSLPITFTFSYKKDLWHFLDACDIIMCASCIRSDRQ